MRFAGAGRCHGRIDRSFGACVIDDMDLGAAGPGREARPVAPLADQADAGGVDAIDGFAPT